jgi:hypothetical protein
MAPAASQWKPLTLRPTVEEVCSTSWEAYISKHERQIERAGGVCKIVLPAPLKPRRNYDGLDKLQIPRAIRQNAVGTKGLYRMLLAEQRPMSFAQFKEIAEVESAATSSQRSGNSTGAHWQPPSPRLSCARRMLARARGACSGWAAHPDVRCRALQHSHRGCMGACTHAHRGLCVCLVHAWALLDAPAPLLVRSPTSSHFQLGAGGSLGGLMQCSHQSRTAVAPCMQAIEAAPLAYVATAAQMWRTWSADSGETSRFRPHSTAPMLRAPCLTPTPRQAQAASVRECVYVGV